MPYICDKFHFRWPERVVFGKCQMSFKHTTFAVNRMIKDGIFIQHILNKGETKTPKHPSRPRDKTLHPAKHMCYTLTTVCLEARWSLLPICRDHYPWSGPLKIHPLGFCLVLCTKTHHRSSADIKLTIRSILVYLRQSVEDWSVKVPVVNTWWGDVTDGLSRENIGCYKLNI